MLRYTGIQAALVAFRRKIGSEQEFDGAHIDGCFLKTTNSVLIAAIRWALSRR